MAISVKGWGPLTARVRAFGTFVRIGDDATLPGAPGPSGTVGLGPRGAPPVTASAFSRIRSMI